ncbi:MAG: Sec-independent protein translocase subunit TatA/TatB [Alphaproteobacteria bacterium]
MLDFGWPELFLIMAIAVLVIGPNEIPVIMVALGRVFRRFQYIKFALSQQFEDVMRDADMDDIRKSVNFEEGLSQNDFDEASADEEFAIVNADILREEQEQKERDSKGADDD